MLFRLLIVIALPLAAQGQYTATDCLLGIASLSGYSYDDISSYGVLYRNDSIYVLSQAGIYEGPDDIAEYIQFRSTNSPYISVDDNAGLPSAFELVGVDPITGVCEIVATEVFRIVTDSETAVNASFTTSYLNKLFFNIPENYIQRVNLYFPPEFVDFYIGQVLQSSRTYEFVCTTMQNNCPAVYEANGNLTLDSCVERLLELPVVSEGGRVDGLDRGCRILHAALASQNPEGHCAHLSFIPFLDPRGRIKCQNSSLLEATDYFEQSDLDFYTAFLNDQTDLPDIGFIVHFAELDEGPSDVPVAAPTSSTSTEAPVTVAPMSAAPVRTISTLLPASPSPTVTQSPSGEGEGPATKAPTESAAPTSACLLGGLATIVTTFVYLM
jgi:hypothetical protein